MSPKLKNVDENLSCPLTNTPDGDFIIDNIEDNIFVGVGLSGHGFKLSNVIGLILSDLIQNGETTYDISPFELNRFNIKT
jgi:glycine/D-amino acid oxidase-like deaminating enzyme